MIWQPRYSVLATLFGTYLLCYTDRMVIATAIPFIAEDFELSPLAMGGVLSAFFAGYAIMQIPGGFLADKFGPNRVMTASVASWSIFTGLTGMASSLPMLFTLRVLFGLSEGPFPPAAAKTIATWFPQEEVGRANGIQLAAVNIGAAIAPVLVAPMIIHWGWTSVFYSLVAPGLIMAALVWFLVKNSPVRSEEKVSTAKAHTERIPLGQVLKTRAVLWCSVTLFFTSIASWGLMNWLPTYLLQARGFSITKMGMMASLPFLAGAVGYYLGGYISDQYFSHQRQVPILFGLLLGGGMTYVAAIAPSGEWAVAALVLAFLFLFVASAGIFTLPLVAVPKEAVGTAFGLVNTVGQVAAFVSPLLVGYVLNTTQRNFTFVFYGFVGLFLLAAASALKIRYPAAQIRSEVLKVS